MQKRRVSWTQLASFRTSTLTEDFDEIEAAEEELRREILHGHAFDAHAQTKPLSHKIYSL